MKRIVTIQDISCMGKVSLTVALPIISSMGITTAVIPTAVLSMHTGFSGFTFCDLTDEIDKISAHWQNRGIAFDGIYTGFLGSFKQLEIVAKFFDNFGGEDKMILVDPCMGDDGVLYPGFDEEFAYAMRNLCAKADVITPNITEACFMCKIKYQENYDEKFILDLLENLSHIGAKKIILKGVKFRENECGVFSLDTSSKKCDRYFHEFLPVLYHGTGDMFASVVFGALMRGKTLDMAVKMAADFVVLAMKKTMENPDRKDYDGVNFEVVIPELVKQL